MLRPFTFTFLATLLMAVAPAQAQTPDLGGTVGGLIDQVPLPQIGEEVQTLSGGAVRDLRQARERAGALLRRRHRDRIDGDSTGSPIVRSEIVAIAPSEAALDAALGGGFAVIERREIAQLGLSLVVLRAPEGMSTRRALAAMRALDPEGSYDFNHIYLGAGDAPTRPRRTRQNTGDGGRGCAIGLIDSGVDVNHRAFAHANIVQRGFASPEPSADAHGSAVAYLLLQAAPEARLCVADVYGGRPDGGSATIVINALAWLIETRVRVINISLVGPRNRALEAAVRAAIARGVIIVAAVGNDGPNAPPLYPAAYPDVVGVTGVDARDRALPEALRGDQIDFAAPGSELRAPGRGDSWRTVRGTSFASPLVTALLAQRSLAAVRSDARDLGARGRDPVFGDGLVAEALRR